MVDKTFIRITNRDIYNELKCIKQENIVQHGLIIKHQLKTNGKVKLNTWRSITALSITLSITIILLLKLLI